MKSKYKITPRLLEEKGAIKQLESDGVSRETISKRMYDITDGASTPERRNIMKKLFDRGER